MSSITIDISGLQEAASMVDPAKVPKMLATAVYDIAAGLRDEAKRMPPVSASTTGYGAIGIPVAPKRGGTLRQAIQARKSGDYTAEVYGDTSVAGYFDMVHNGVAPFVLNRPVFIDGVGWRFIGTHPGMPARPFLVWLVESVQGRQVIDTVLQRTVDRLLAL